MKSAGAIQKNTEKRASHDVLFSLCENAADKLILLVLLGSVLLFILWPIACIALRSLRGADGGVSFAMFGTVLRQYGESLRNSVFVGVFTAVLSTILSLSAALVCFIGFSAFISYIRYCSHVDYLTVPAMFDDAG